jgi:predicted nucleic acid-binding protein
MMLVLDTSAAMEVVLHRPFAKRFIDRLLIADTVLSPDLFRAEVANTLAKYVRGGWISMEEGGKALSFCVNMVDEYIPAEENEIESFSESVRLGHSAYDMFYLTLARRNGASLLTCDKRLGELCKEERIHCVSAGESSGEAESE